MVRIRRNTLVALIIVVLLASSAAYFWMVEDRVDDSKDSRSTGATTQNEAIAPSDESLASIGKYRDYDAQAFESDQGERWLFFHASWCPQCRELDASISSGQVPEGVTVYKVDYDSETDLRKRYGVTIQTTVVSVDAEDQVVARSVPYEEPSLSNVITDLR